ncbi:uncharacterized protein BP5553_01416 [Venustampulla echinocandica]|uniref:Xylanolytic transcriptional activator regulatory domain-containing protein n=1 Tax=Venustampulla echinocandica TaxID=2656787 RepID=A0A370U0Z0_9HELO|nr:uncharacterized protein BP5553_01416 [Venustampulla echinocandica]RDL41437.1 hypothetical protein BP5553_01416 [Venustampulla echinocandica]
MFSDNRCSISLDFDDVTFEHFDADALGILPDFDLSDYPSANWLDLINLTVETRPPQETRALSTNSHEYSFPFLDSFTSRTGFVSSFDCGSLIQRQGVLVAVLRSLAKGEPALSQLVPGHLDFGTGHSKDATPLATIPLLQSSWPYDPLSLKTSEIILLVKEVVTVKPRNSAVTITWSLALEEKCSVFFSSTNLRKFLELYWAIWHPNVNFVHRPTFNPAGCKPILLASMALIGACVSPDPADNEDAKTWFNCVEEMVFIDDDFCSDTLSTNTAPFNPPWDRRKIEALQAAYMVVLYQNWEGTDASKRRMRRYRYSNVVSAARDISIGSAKHANYNQQTKQEFNWGEFVAREELIRTFLWIFLLDHAFTIFYNLPPRMVIKEMKMHMAFPESCFQAATEDECYEQIQSWMLGLGRTCCITLRTAVEDACEKVLVQDTHRNLARLGPLNLFAIVSALHALIFQYQNSFGGEAQVVSIRNALGNWIRIWKIYSTELSSTPPHVLINDCLNPENMWRRVGFLRNSLEYWSLASLILDRISTSSTNQRDHGITSDTNLSRRTALQDGPASPILDKYDQTSMRQVNDLIADFQKVQIC